MSEAPPPESQDPPPPPPESQGFMTTPGFGSVCPIQYFDVILLLFVQYVDISPTLQGINL